MCWFVLFADHVAGGKVLLVSMDGFRWDYLQTVPDLSNFTRLAKLGVSAKFANTTFVTKSFPTHYSIVTGCYQENHGIVGNNMYDPEHDAYFTKDSTEEFWWNQREPIWSTVVRNGKKAGVNFWPGSMANVSYPPTERRVYDETADPYERIAVALSWFNEPNNYDFVAMYFDQPDGAGHVFGVNHTGLRDEIQKMDMVLGAILKTLQERNLENVVDFILTSDHGMTSCNISDKLINVSREADLGPEVVRYTEKGAIMGVWPAPGMEDQVVQKLQSLSHVTVYRKKDIPDRFHYKNNSRIAPVILLADEHWLLTNGSDRVFEKNSFGDHGYDPDLESMKTIFFAKGPSFKQNFRVAGVRLVDIYSLLCHLLKVPASNHDGNIQNMKDLLVDGIVSSAAKPSISIVIAAAATIVAVIH
ncbi:hypothetical protein C0Q70_09096 [Pomacea canaliculata]|uniref:Ectonucleotide pyrophosphatase/phosphodiesterase family member 5 n=3 Tax=Pomacea canaliculata TaxID=400727 RepID=A0A2T7P8U6_POMCA|nr:hypothetical protein C0Q70_09096 [Pomacea canaliculata]